MRPQSLVQVARERAAQQAERRAYLFLSDGQAETASFTYAELDEAARAIAARLQALGGGPKQALLLYPPGLEFVTGFLGCLYADVAAVPVVPPRPSQSLARLQAIAEDSQSTIALTTASLMPLMLKITSGAASLGGLEWIATDEVPLAAAAEWKDPGADSLAFLQYTSGSTGLPKGVMVSHRNLMANSEYLRNCFELSADSVSVTWLPSFHDMGLVDGILQPLYTGFLGVVMPPVAFLQNPFRWLQGISKYGATHCGGPNFGYELCTRKITDDQLASLDLSTWVTAYNGAEPVNSDTLERFAQRFAPCGFKRRYFYPCYGMAESTLIISGGSVAADPVYFNADADALESHDIVEASAETARRKSIVGCGWPWMDTKVAIADPETLGPCDASRVGEIWVAGESVTSGYWNRPELNAETFATLDGAEYLRTGDLGFQRDGQLFVTGRIKDVIIIRGENHYPQDIEETVQNCFDGLRASCGAAFTVLVKDQERLVVVQEVERTHVRHLDAPAIVKKMREAVANEHGLQLYDAVLIKPASIPKTSSGKIQRRATRQAYLNGELEVVVSRSGTAGAGTDTTATGASGSSAPETADANR